MKFERFCVTNYRNIKDSGWIEINNVTSFIGQNEAGKSNLFEALYRVNPFESEATYNIDEDWPMDDWGNKGNADEVCRAQFSLDQEEIASLFAYASPKSDEADNDNAGEEDASKSKLKLPKSLILDDLAPESRSIY